jgi:hypothetical protein
MVCCHDTKATFIFVFPPQNSGGKGIGWGKYQITEVKGQGYRDGALHQLLSLKKALEVTHLPDASEDEDDGLSNGPPQDPLVGALTGQTKAFFTIPLVVLLLPPDPATGGLGAAAPSAYP